MSSEVSVIWSKLLLTVNPDCTYSINSTNIHSYPTSFAKVTYPTTTGAKQTYSSQNVVFFHSEVHNSVEKWAGSNLVTTSYGTNFSGFTEMLTAVAPPPFFKGPFGPSTDSPANYTFKLQLPSTFLIISPSASCTYSYRMTSGPAFGGMKPSPCTPGNKGQSHCPETCPAGNYRANITSDGATAMTGSGYVCALCPAGTTSSKDSSSSGCQPCQEATIAAAVGSTSCQACLLPNSPSPTKSTCVRCDDINPTLPDNAIYGGTRAHLRSVPLAALLP